MKIKARNIARGSNARGVDISEERSFAFQSALEAMGIVSEPARNFTSRRVCRGSVRGLNRTRFLHLHRITAGIGLRARLKFDGVPVRGTSSRLSNNSRLLLRSYIS